MTPERRGIFSFESIAVDVKRLEVRRNGKRIELEPKAFLVLSYLVENRDRVVTKEELIGRIWAGTFVTDNALTRVISQIRKQLGDNARSPRFIETVATSGYRFVGHAVEETAPAVPPAKTLPISKELPKWRMAASIAAVMAIAGGAWWVGHAPRANTARIGGLQQVTSSPGSDLGASFSPDGGQIAFSSDRSGRFEIYVRSLAPGSAERQITSDGGNNIEPAWSPNGQQIAFASQKRGGISVVPATGGAIRYITDTGSEPAWSPDGRTLVYQAGAIGKVNLWLASLDGTPPRPLTRSGTPPGDHEYPKWLADGRHVVFSAFFPTKGKPWVVETTNGQLQRIQIATDSVLFPCLPDGGQFLYFTTPAARGAAVPLDPVGVWRARIDRPWQAQKPELLIPSGGLTPMDLAVSADGSRIAISQMRHETAFWSLPLDRSGLSAGEPRRLIEDASLGLSEPAFSPDGAQLAYASLHQGDVWTVLVSRLDGSSPYPITAAGQSGRIISWIGNDSVAYLSERQGKREYWRAPLQGPPQRMDLPLDFGPYAFMKVSPQGTRLVAHAGNRSIGIKLVLIDLATGTSRDLTPPGRTFVFPSWSPDGRWISAVERIDPSVDHRVVINVSTGAIQMLADAPDDPIFFPSSWAPDNDRIVFAGLGDGISNVYWISRSTGQQRQLTRFHSQSENVRGPVWSPKGDRIVFLHSATSANIYTGELQR